MVFKAVSAERGQLSRLLFEPPVRFEPRTHRLRGWIVDFPLQVPRRLLENPVLVVVCVVSLKRVR